MVVERTYGGVSAAERRSTRRRQLVDAVIEVWGGADSRLTMTAVCQQAGLTERYFYESFDRLDAAQLAVIEEIAAVIERRTAEALADAAGEPSARARAVVSAFLGVLTGDPRLARILVHESTALASLRAARSLVLRRLARRAGREARRLRGPEAWDAYASATFAGGVLQLVDSWLDGSVDADPKGLAAAAERHFRAIAG